MFEAKFPKRFSVVNEEAALKTEKNLNILFVSFLNDYVSTYPKTKHSMVQSFHSIEIMLEEFVSIHRPLTICFEKVNHKSSH